VLDQNLYDWAALVIVLPALLFVVDWTLTLTGARAYHSVSDRWSVEGSYEMNPAWETAVERGKWLNARMVLATALYFALTAALWLLARAFDFQIGDERVGAAGLFAFGVGLILLVEAPTLMNHAANLLQFRAMGDPSAMTGQARFARWFALNETGWFYLRFAALWLILGIASFQLFFLGGALGCLTTGLRFWRAGRSARTAPSLARVGPFNVDALRARSDTDTE
jgi:hypothetical protein